MATKPERQDQPFVFPSRRRKEQRYPEEPLGTPGGREWHLRTLLKGDP